MCDLNEQQLKKLKSNKTSKYLRRETVNKRCLRSNSHKRQSFSERICDDLCEEILQYLSLEDKLKLEGVSKQFQRTVLKKHYELTIVSNNISVSNKSNYVYIENTFNHLKSLEVLLKKCPNITSIDLRSYDKYYFSV